MTKLLERRVRKEQGLKADEEVTIIVALKPMGSWYKLIQFMWDKNETVFLEVSTKGIIKEIWDQKEVKEKKPMMIQSPAI